LVVRAVATQDCLLQVLLKQTQFLSLVVAVVALGKALLVVLVEVQQVAMVVQAQRQVELVDLSLRQEPLAAQERLRQVHY
jgi:hypothetical protein